MVVWVYITALDLSALRRGSVTVPLNSNKDACTTSPRYLPIRELSVVSLM